MNKVARFDPISIVASEFFGLNWNVEVSTHVAECRAEWLSLVEHGEKEHGIR